MMLKKLYSRIMPASKYQLNKKAGMLEKENEEIIQLQGKLKKKITALSKELKRYEEEDRKGFDSVIEYFRNTSQSLETKVIGEINMSVSSNEKKLEKVMEDHWDKNIHDITGFLDRESKSVKDSFGANEKVLESILYRLSQQEFMLQNICYEQQKLKNNIGDGEENAGIGNKKSVSEEITEQKQIPVVLSADNNYGIPMLVTIASALYNKSDKSNFIFYLMVPGDFSDTLKGMIDEIISMYPGTTVRYIVMGNEFSKAYVGIEHITVPTYYRLKIPQLLPEVDKCIYLDVDIIVKQDLGQLFDVELHDAYAAGVRALGYYNSEERMARRAEYLGIEHVNNYINAGVLLLNLKKIREEDVQRKFVELLDKNFNSQDQDILNVAFFDKIKILPFKYNVMTKYDLFHETAYDETEFIRRCLTKEDWDEGRKTPVIIHYADKEKPWNKLESVYAKEWWNIVSRLPSKTAVYIYDSYISKMIFEAGH